MKRKQNRPVKEETLRSRVCVFFFVLVSLLFLLLAITSLHRLARTQVVDCYDYIIAKRNVYSANTSNQFARFIINILRILASFFGITRTDVSLKESATTDPNGNMYIL